MKIKNLVTHLEHEHFIDTSTCGKRVPESFYLTTNTNSVDCKRCWKTKRFTELMELKDMDSPPLHGRTIIAGSRSITDYAYVKSCLDTFNEWQITEIISGHTIGPDRLGEQWANEKDLPIIYFYPDWNIHGKSAGFIRNEEMATNADGLITFWDGRSNGTRDMITRARKKGLKVKVFMEYTK